MDKPKDGMLVLTRKKDECIVCLLDGTAIWIRVNEIEPGKVRLGFKAANQVKIYREEVLDRLDDSERERILGV